MPEGQTPSEHQIKIKRQDQATMRRFEQTTRYDTSYALMDGPGYAASYQSYPIEKSPSQNSTESSCDSATPRSQGGWSRQVSFDPCPPSPTSPGCYSQVSSPGFPIGFQPLSRESSRPSTDVFQSTHYQYYESGDVPGQAMEPKQQSYAGLGDSTSIATHSGALVAETQNQTGNPPGFCCLTPGCSSKMFKRKADLARHYKHMHLAASRQDSFPCDYTRCNRSSPDNTFRRRDHYRDHLRDYHKEDICKRGSSVTKDWLENRKVKKDWWRCHRCLMRVNIAYYGFACPTCNTSCDDDRQQRRKI